MVDLGQLPQLCAFRALAIKPIISRFIFACVPARRARSSLSDGYRLFKAAKSLLLKIKISRLEGSVVLTTLMADNGWKWSSLKLDALIVSFEGWIFHLFRVPPFYCGETFRCIQPSRFEFIVPPIGLAVFPKFTIPLFKNALIFLSVKKTW